MVGSNTVPIDWNPDEDRIMARRKAKKILQRAGASRARTKETVSSIRSKNAASLKAHKAKLKSDATANQKKARANAVAKGDALGRKMKKRAVERKVQAATAKLKATTAKPKATTAKPKAAASRPEPTQPTRAERMKARAGNKAASTRVPNKNRPDNFSYFDKAKKPVSPRGQAGANRIKAKQGNRGR